MHFGDLKGVSGIFYGVSPAVIALILHSSYRLARLGMEDRLQWFIAAACFAVTVLLEAEVAILFILSGTVGLLYYGRLFKGGGGQKPLLALSPAGPVLLATAAGAPEAASGSVFIKLLLFFLKAGAFTFGSGLVIVPFLQQGLVTEYGWLSEREFLIAVAVGMISPGPVVITATFVGYLVAGFLGSLVSTIGIFLPSFFIVLIVARHRERVLSEQELAEIWQACREDDYEQIVKLLILTGQRRREIGDLSWSEIDLKKSQIDLPSARTKNKLPHIVPISTAAIRIIRNLPRHTDRDLVFGEGEGGFQGWARAKRSLDARVDANRRQTGKKPMPAWVIHDLRRSVNTLLNEKGIAHPHIVEAIMNHVSGHKANIAGVYNKANYLSEKRQALEAWGGFWSTFMEGCDGQAVSR